MAPQASGPDGDWADSVGGYALAWGLPILVIVAASFLADRAQAVVWSLALAWMGIACIANARRCGRVHCRFTGPYYLLLIVPVLLHGSRLVSFGRYAWWILAALILLGGKVIWWATETMWGKYAAAKQIGDG